MGASCTVFTQFAILGAWCADLSLQEVARATAHTGCIVLADVAVLDAKAAVVAICKIAQLAGCAFVAIAAQAVVS